MNDQVEPATAQTITRVVVAVAAEQRRAELARAIRSKGFDVVGVQGLEQVVDAVDPDEPSVVLVDDARAGWLREIADLLQARPGVRPLALVHIESPAEMLTAVSAGVMGFVVPTASATAIARAVEELAGGGVAIPRGLVGALVDEVRRGRGRTVETSVGSIEVTEREWEILQLLLQRRSTKEIAEMLFVSVGTVRTHVSALGRKLGAHAREDTIRLLEEGLG